MGTFDGIMRSARITFRGRDILRDGQKVGEIIGGRSHSSKHGASGGYGYRALDGRVIVARDTFSYFRDVQRDAADHFRRA